MTRPYETTFDPYAQRRTLIRTVLFLIILATLPFYLLGFWVWGSSEDPSAPGTEGTITATNTALATSTSTNTPSITPFTTLPGQATLGPTPRQFIPPPPQPTNTQVIFVPNPTTAPTLTFPPTNTQPPPATNTAPAPTATSLPPPTDTEPPPPTDTAPAPTATNLLPPTDTATP
jgi:hypothetical protein